MNPVPVIRIARHSDLTGLLALYRHLNPSDPPLSAEAAASTWARMLADPSLRIFLAEVAGRTVASCMLILTANLTRGARPFGTIENVVTDAAYRNRGLGKAVLRAACDVAWQEGAYKVMLMTGSKQEATLRFYAAAGFQRGKTAFEIRR